MPKPIELNSTIAAVTVYVDRAEVTRTASQTLKAGEHRLLFTPLPFDIEEKSIRVSGKGPAVLEDIRFQEEHYAVTPDIDLQSLVEQKTGLEERLWEINDKIEAVKKEKALVESIAVNLSGGQEKAKKAELDPDKWIKMVDFYRERLGRLNSEIREFTKSQEVVDAELAKTDRDLSAFHEGSSLTRNQVLVTLEMQEEAELVLELKYIVYGPGWTPLYDIRVDSREKTMTVQYNAMITQSSREDWTDASLNLSTAQAHVSGQQPELTPWHVSMFVPMLASSSRPMRMKSAKAAPAPAGQMFESVAADESMEPEEAEMELYSPESVIETGAVSTVFSVGGSNTIVADGQPHKVCITIEKFGAHFRYSAAAKLSPHAYLKARVTNTSDYPFLPGETNIFLDASFVSTARMDLVSPGEEFWTFLGVDDSIKVEHFLLKRYHKKEGIVARKEVLIYEYLIKLTNNKKTDEEMVVWDQLPISGDAEIAVKLIDPVYKEDSDSLKKNEHEFLEWFFMLKAAEKKEIPLTFSVEYPKGRQVTGI